MKIRNLKRKSGEAVISVWPPLWTGFYKSGDKLALGEEGVLKSVERRIGDRLSLRIEYDGREHVGSLQWDAPPPLDNIEKVLRANIGKAIKAISELDVSDK